MGHVHQFEGGDGRMICAICGEERRYDQPYHELTWPKLVGFVVLLGVLWPLFWLARRNHG